MPDNDTTDQPSPERRRSPAAPDNATPTVPPAQPTGSAQQRTEQLRDEVAGKKLLATVWPCTEYTVPGAADDGTDDLVITLDGTPVNASEVDGLVGHAARQDVQLVELQP